MDADIAVYIKLISLVNVWGRILLHGYSQQLMLAYLFLLTLTGNAHWACSKLGDLMVMIWGGAVKGYASIPHYSGMHMQGPIGREYTQNWSYWDIKITHKESTLTDFNQPQPSMTYIKWNNGMVCFIVIIACMIRTNGRQACSMAPNIDKNNAKKTTTKIIRNYKNTKKAKQKKKNK